MPQKIFSIEEYVKAQDVLNSIKVGTEKVGRNAVLEWAINYVQEELEKHYYGK